MDIGVPYRDLGNVDAAEAAAYVDALSDAVWEENTFRQALLAGNAHRITRAIPLKHNFVPYQMPWRVRSMTHLLIDWCKQEGFDPEPLMPTVEAANDMGEVNVFPAWERHRHIIEPLVDQAIDYIRTPTGQVHRIAIVEMAPGTRIEPHIDGQPMAARAHRVHIPLVSPPGVEYKIAGKRFMMRVGKAYDFNNRVQHQVRNKSKRRRINILIDYLPDPGPAPVHAMPPKHNIL